MAGLIIHCSVHVPISKLALKITMIMADLLPQELHPKAKAQENNEAFKRRMKLWADCKFKELLSEDKTIQKIRQQSTDFARLFRLKMENGQIRQAARLLEKEKSWVILPLNEGTLRKMKLKHPVWSPTTVEVLQGEKKQSRPVIYVRIQWNW